MAERVKIPGELFRQPLRVDHQHPFKDWERGVPILTAKTRSLITTPLPETSAGSEPMYRPDYQRRVVVDGGQDGE